MAKLSDYARTKRQMECLEVWESCGRNASKAAGKLGITHGTVRNTVNTVKSLAAASGYSDAWDATSHVPEGEIVIGRSLYLEDDSGNRAWLKTKRKMEAAEKEAGLKAFVEELTKELPPAKAVSKTKSVGKSKELVPTIVIGDAHIGMRASRKETRSRNFDSKIASQEIADAVDYLVDAAPACTEAVLVDVGDYMHANSHKNTTANLTPLDVDTRIESVMRIAAQTMNQAVTRMLQKHDRVTVVVARGNHNSDTAIAIAMILSAYWRDEKRVTVLEPNGFCHFLTIGEKNLIGVHHGDKIKSDKLATMMPRVMPKAWAASSHRYWLVGHFHHKTVQEFDTSVVVEKFGTLAPPDSWHAGQGYGSSSVMNQLIFRRSGGIAIRHTYEIQDPQNEPDQAI